MTFLKNDRDNTVVSSITHSSTSTSFNNKPSMTRCLLSVAIASSLLLVGCGDDDNDRVVSDATSVKPISSFSANQINTQFGLNDTATPLAKCDIKIEKVSYRTVGAAGERTNATAALMLPSGESADCQGDRPVLLYAHGTTTDKGYDFAQVGNVKNPAVGEANLIAANFAAQGYIVVAPNYAGYDESNLDYHPYLVADQQATDMADALDSARKIIERRKSANDANYSKIDDSGKLFIAGYSQGGHVTMATARLLQSQNKPVTAIAPSSGPYALAAFGDAIFAGNVNIGATRFAPLLAVGLQKVDGKLYRNPTEIFTDQYANTKLPNELSFDELTSNKVNKLPKNALFQAPPTGYPDLDALPPSKLPFAPLGFANDGKYLIQTSYRNEYIMDAIAHPDGVFPTVTTGLPAENPENNLRKALKVNDLRSYTPKMPTLLCGGSQDPTVFYDINTGSMSAILQQASAAPDANLNITVLDVDTRNDRGALTPIGSAMSNPWMTTTVIDNLQDRFSATLIGVQNKAIADARAAGVTDPVILEQAAGAAILGSYHGGLVSASCTEATREFFEQNFNQL
ncbi:MULTISPECIES: alpha/beta hydrolase family protein [unclassified Psychrobacter]|uniref:alpha/beta hydrolase family protein n=1 Tax=unclassified Psychrobacter TaxID=196806 RepID=UPI0025F16558|nr:MULTISPECIES: alpha/beta fold hydrolase [unclassified Psychrobacter]